MRIISDRRPTCINPSEKARERRESGVTNAERSARRFLSERSLSLPPSIQGTSKNTGLPPAPLILSVPVAYVPEGGGGLTEDEGAALHILRLPESSSLDIFGLTRHLRFYASNCAALRGVAK